MRVLQQPGAVGLLFGSEQLDGFVHPLVGGVPGGTEVLQGTEHVVVPASRKRELQHGRVGHPSVSLTPKHFPSEESLPPRAASRDGLRRATVTRSCASSPSSTLTVVANE